MTVSEGPSLPLAFDLQGSAVFPFLLGLCEEVTLFDQKRSAFSPLSIHNFQLYLRVPCQVHYDYQRPSTFRRSGTQRPADANE
jgi:hypothetical protein